MCRFWMRIPSFGFGYECSLFGVFMYCVLGLTFPECYIVYLIPGFEVGG